MCGSDELVTADIAGDVDQHTDRSGARERGRRSLVLVWFERVQGVTSRLVSNAGLRWPRGRSGMVRYAPVE